MGPGECLDVLFDLAEFRDPFRCLPMPELGKLLEDDFRLGGIVRL
jgi:hypothetical protein